MTMMRLFWHSTRKPNRAELAAIRRAIRSGALKSGAHIGPAVRSNPSSSNPAKAAYEAFHWGRAPRRTRAVTLPDYAAGVYELGPLVAVEYEATKGRERRATWRHEFGSPRPILTATSRGRLGPIVGGKATVTRRGIEG